jgi:hypothetical protein
MIRRMTAVLLGSGLLLATWALAQEPQPPADKDEPPLRLKKKQPPDESKPDQPKEKKPAAEDKKPDEPGKEPEPAEPQENEKEVLDRVARNMSSLEERLANKELGDATRQVGDDIVKDLDALIRMMENPPQGGGGGGDMQNDPSGSSGGQKNQGGQAGSSGQRNASGNGQRGNRPNRGGNSQQPGGGSQPTGGQPKPDRSDRPMANGQPEKNNGPSGTSDKNRRGGNDDKSELNKNADLYKDVWGHLPESLRAEMNAYSTDKELIPKYDALIKKCSRTIAEQSTRKAP